MKASSSNEFGSRPRNAILTWQRYVLTEVSSMARTAMARLPEPHSCVRACNAASCALQPMCIVIGASVSFPTPVRLVLPWPYCWFAVPPPPCRSASTAFLSRSSWLDDDSGMGMLGAGCWSAWGSRDTVPCWPHGNISQCIPPQRRQLDGGGPFKSNDHPLLLVRMVWSPTCDILALTCGWCRVPVMAACGQILA